MSEHEVDAKAQELIDKTGCNLTAAYRAAGIQLFAVIQQEVARLRDERDRYKQIAEDAVAYRLPAPVIVDIGLRQRAESAESSLLAVREALKEAQELIAFNQYPDDHSTMVKIAAALSTTSAQAEGIKARWQAEALRDAADELLVSNCLSETESAVWLRARAAQLTAKTEEEGREG